VTRFVIKKFVLGKVPEVDITRAEYARIKKSWNMILYVLRLESIADFLIRSYEELEHECLRIALKASISHDFDWQEIIDETHTVDRRIFNLLASSKAYIDKARSLTKKIGGLSLLEELDAVRGEQFDKNFSYRLLEYLRNHSQHAGTTTDALFRYSGMEEVPESDSEFSDTRFVFVARPKLNINGLLDSRQLKPQLRSELLEKSDKGGRIDLLPHVRKYVSCLGVIHERMRNHIVAEAELAWDNIHEIIDRYIAIHGKDTVGLCAVALGDGFIASDKVPLFSQPYDRIKKLNKRNVHISKIHKWIVSSELPVRERKK